MYLYIVCVSINIYIVFIYSISALDEDAILCYQKRKKKGTFFKIISKQYFKN